MTPTNRPLKPGHTRTGWIGLGVIEPPRVYRRLVEDAGLKVPDLGRRCARLPRVRGRLRLLATITRREVIERILTHLGLPSDPVVPEPERNRLRAAPTAEKCGQSEFESGRIPGALHFPFWTHAADLDSLPPEAASGPVVLYCEHGSPAGIARAQIWVADTGPVLYSRDT